ncbi:LysR family transcriptional regulator [Pseudomonas sp. AFG_SD02_1510_Pfu_092]|uniref:LysR family transcriptional regulator n=1 Tax=Pseudomonas sp. AFG_SD02_1510_Pfu_092 TaxID=2259497 RepID=UPI000DEF27CA|nr:LysR family transcriptional regulator [Pseudomonas sp. AFG_SD02_1510_Pfu_092]RCL26847.1 LysR family transcriptional regulator [Pseudomonas sp. AFG_SD02_1510_Pfu_092]
MDKFLALSMFVETVRCGGYSAAARKLGVATSSVARQVAALEAELGTTLITRSTRQNSPTDLGQAYFDNAVAILDALAAADSLVTDRGSEAKGKLRVSVPVEFGRRLISPHLGRFLAAHPELEVSLNLNDGMVDLFKDRVDLAVRLGSTVSSEEVICSTIGHFQRWLVASPAYLQQHGAPTQPGELSGHACMRFDYGGPLRDWHFQVDGQTVPVAVQGRMQSNNADILRQAAVAGQGVALLADWLVAEDVQHGRLTRLLPEYEVNPTAVNASINIVYLPINRESTRIRVFAQFMKELLNIA